MPIRIAIVGYGKIARDEHLPAIAGDPCFELVAVVSSRPQPSCPAPCFPSIEALTGAMAGQVDAASICTPPTVRHALARSAFAAGLHVLVEKPPAATLGELAEIARLGREAQRTLFTAWHSQHAAAVPAAKAALNGRTVRSLDIEWHEDVRKWHPGQEWIWSPGGFGVFDPGINALSIATRILPMPLFVGEAVLLFPRNKQTPIAARLGFAGEADLLAADFDWRSGEGESWTIRIETGDGTILELVDGGAKLLIDGEPQSVESRREYPALYTRFAELIERSESDVDMEPLRIVADAFLIGSRETVGPFL